MVYKVVSTKLTEEEHTKLLDICNKHGCTPSTLIKDVIMNKIQEEVKEKDVEEKELSPLKRWLKHKREKQMAEAQENKE